MACLAVTSTHGFRSRNDEISALGNDIGEAGRHLLHGICKSKGQKVFDVRSPIISILPVDQLLDGAETRVQSEPSNAGVESLSDILNSPPALMCGNPKSPPSARLKHELNPVVAITRASTYSLRETATKIL